MCEMVRGGQKESAQHKTQYAVHKTFINFFIGHSNHGELAHWLQTKSCETVPEKVLSSFQL